MFKHQEDVATQIYPPAHHHHHHSPPQVESSLHVPQENQEQSWEWGDENKNEGHHVTIPYVVFEQVTI